MPRFLPTMKIQRRHDLPGKGKIRSKKKKKKKKQTLLAMPIDDEIYPRPTPSRTRYRYKSQTLVLRSSQLPLHPCGDETKLGETSPGPTVGTSTSQSNQMVKRSPDITT